MKGDKFLMMFIVAVVILSLTFTTVGADTPLPNQTIDWDKLAPVEEDGYTLQPDQYVFQEDGISIDGIAIQLSPVFESTYAKKPTFYFTRDYAAKKNLYGIRVWDVLNEEFVYPYYESYATCPSFYCYIQPIIKLEPAGLSHDGYYQWAIQSHYPGIGWQSWSDFAPFRVMLKKYADTFNRDPVDWYFLNGDWLWAQSKGLLKAYANSGYWASALRDGYFYDVDYTVRMKHKDSLCASAVIIRGTPDPYGDEGQWDDGVYFQYSNSGLWAIWKVQDGDWSFIQGWIDGSSFIKENDWNELRIVSAFPYFDVWLNGNYLGWFSDETYTLGGYTGVGFVNEDYYQKFLVDYAKATAVQYTSLAERDPDMQLGLEPAPEGMVPWQPPVD